MDNLPFPRLHEIEQSVLGALILEPHAIDCVAATLHADLFYDLSHQAVCKAVLSLYERHDPIDMFTVLEELGSLGLANQAGGAFTVVSLAGMVNSSAHLAYHTALLCDKHLQRELIKCGMEISAEAFDETKDVGETLEHAIKRVNDICVQVFGRSPMIKIADAADMAERAYQEREMKFLANEQIGVTTGLKGLDKITSGWHKGDLAVIAGRPAMGKTAFMLSCAAAAAESGSNVVLFSLEMGARQLVDRMALRHTDAPADGVRNGSLSQAHRSELYAAYERLRHLPVTLDETAGITMNEIRGRAAELIRKGKCDLIIIDYLQLLSTSSENKQYNREQQVAQLSRKAKLMAKDLDVPVVILAQLSRNSENRGNRKPFLSDLRESGAIEQDADLVMFVHRQEYYTPGEKVGVGTLIVAKNRNGETCEIDFHYNKSLTRITD